MDTIFNALGCKEQDKKRLDVFQLTYSAAEWWEAEKAAFGEETIGRLSWVDFKTKFLGKYFPDFEKNKKEKEFIDLVQGTRTVQEYTIQFERLSRFSPHIVDTLVKRNKRFIRGVNTTIQGHMMNSFAQSFESIVEHATNLEVMYGTSQQ